MSAPNTNIEKQERRHKPSLLGIALSVGIAAILLLAFIVYVFLNGQEPGTADTQIDGRTGEVVETN